MFQKPSAKKMPMLACLGVLAEAEEAKETKSRNYQMVPLTINGLEAAPSVNKVWFLFRPEWFEPDFDTLSLSSSEAFVYENNILSSDPRKVSLLRALCGEDPALFDSVADRLHSGEDINSVMKSLIGNLVGFTLKQESEKTGRIDDEGNDIRILLGRYNVDGFFIPTENKIKSMIRRGERSDETAFVCTFSDSTKGSFSREEFLAGQDLGDDSVPF